MDPLLHLAAKRKLTIIEDAAQAHGSEYKGKRAGSMGAIGCFSFYPGKNLGAFGEGGAVVTNHDEFARRIRMLRDWGAEKKYHHVLKGYNYRLEGLQGAILRVKLRHLEKWTEARRSHARWYSDLLQGRDFLTPVARDYARHVFHVYVIRVKRNRDELQKHLHQKRIQAAIHYPVPIHLMPAYLDLGYQLGDFPEAEKAAAEVLSLPLYPELNEDLMTEVVSGCMTWVNSR
jgi:dTDP-4-amino-4,6-dideoxygalactose transaminase